jgi:hypothetical protein
MALVPGERPPDPEQPEPVLVLPELPEQPVVRRPGLVSVLDRA